jgi:hypothetical protein
MDMFKPELSLAREPDGEFTLHAITLTPNSCFSAGCPSDGAPPGYSTIPEAHAITLGIDRRDGICLMAIRPVRHTIPNISLGNGKTSVVAFTALNDGTVVGQNCITMHDVDRMTMVTKETRSVLNSCDWTAMANLRPPPPDSLVVRGQVQVPDPGYVGTLTPAVPQGINPAQLILDLKLRKLPGIWPQVLTWIEVVHHDGNYAGGHDTVLIRFPDGATQVIEIHKAF